MKFWRLSKHGVRPISMHCVYFGDHVRTICGPCLASFTSRPARALKFLRLNQHGLRTMSMECLFLGTMSGPCGVWGQCQYHVGTLFDLAFKTSWSLYFWDCVWTIFGQDWQIQTWVNGFYFLGLLHDHVWTIFETVQGPFLWSIYF